MVGYFSLYSSLYTIRFSVWQFLFGSRERVSNFIFDWNLLCLWEDYFSQIMTGKQLFLDKLLPSTSCYLALHARSTKQISCFKLFHIHNTHGTNLIPKKKHLLHGMWRKQNGTHAPKLSMRRFCNHYFIHLSRGLSRDL